MANSITHSRLPYPVRNARYTLLVPFRDNTGAPADPTTPDTEVSVDAGAFADAVEEITTVTGSNGFGYVTLTGAETNGSAVGVAFKSANAITTQLVLYPRDLPVLQSGTAQAGAASTITLSAGSAAIDYSGCIVRTTGGTGGGSTGGANNQARQVVSTDTSNPNAIVLTVAPSWETNPDATTTYDILITDMWSNVNLVAVRGSKASSLAGTIDANLTAVAGSTSIDGVTVAKFFTAQLSKLVGKISVTDNGNGTSTLSFKKQDGTTESFHLTYDSTTGARTTTGVVS